MESSSQSLLNFDLEKVSLFDLNDAVRVRADALASLVANGTHAPLVNLELINSLGQHFIGAGMRNVGEVVVKGAIGDFGFCSFADGQAMVEGNVGDFFGHSIASGMLIVHGHAKHATGALGLGGLIAIYGNVQDRVAVGLQGADVVVRGSVGSNAGLGMQSGTLIIGGTSGQGLGRGMSGGTIYIRGEAESVSEDIEEQRLREPDRLKIGMLMLKSNIKSSGKEFRVFRPVREDS